MPVSVYIKCDPEKVLGNGELVQTLRKLKKTADTTHFVCVEPYVWEYQGDESEAVAIGKFDSLLRKMDVLEKFEQYLIRYENGEIEDALKSHREVDEHLHKIGWKK